MCAYVENMRFTVVASVQIFCLCIHVRFSREYGWKCFCLGGKVASVLKLDRRQGSVTNAKTSARGGACFGT